ncbi:protein of unknown function (plasmid) [Shinella sp. WSC3-e]|nr:protein of unknown function [Shinella sp. WSC3-e]
MQNLIAGVLQHGTSVTVLRFS